VFDAKKVEHIWSKIVPKSIKSVDIRKNYVRIESADVFLKQRKKCNKIKCLKR